MYRRIIVLIHDVLMELQQEFNHTTTNGRTVQVFEVGQTNPKRQSYYTSHPNAQQAVQAVALIVHVAEPM
jgi:hypothetical protein